MPEKPEPIRWKTTRIVDAHTHCGGKEPLAHYLDLLTMVNHTKSIILMWRAVEGNPPDHPALKAKKEHPDRFYIYGSLAHSAENIAARDGRDFPRQVENLLKSGFDGIKMLEGSPYFKKALPHPLDSEYFKPFWEKAEETRVPVTLHLANPRDCWESDEQHEVYRGAEPQEEYFRQAEAVLERHPRLRITFAHFMFMAPQLERLDKLLSRHPEMHVDLAMGQDYMYFLSDDVQKSRRFFIKWQDRILYGTDLNDGNSLRLGRAKCDQVRLFLETDSTFVSQTSLAMDRPPLRVNGRVELRGLNLPQETLEKILGGNVEKLLGKNPKSKTISDWR